jgi:hypothetical protein
MMNPRRFAVRAGAEGRAVRGAVDAEGEYPQTWHGFPRSMSNPHVGQEEGQLSISR